MTINILFKKYEMQLKGERGNIIMEDLISVIVPIYNVEKYLDKCIQSIIGQTYKNLEIILVDDGSKDNSGKICDKYAKEDSRIKVIHKKNGGMSDARNKGLEAASGKYIQFVDSDDYMAENMMEILHKDLIENDADISLCAHYIVRENEFSTDASYEKIVYTNREAIEEFLLDTKIRSYVWNKMFKKSLFDNIKFPTGRVFEDLLTISKIFTEAKRLVLDDTPLYYYVQREGSVLHTQTKELRLAYINATFEVYDYIKSKFDNMEKFYNFNIALITINTYNDIGLFKMYDLIDEEIIQNLYIKTKKIFEDKEMESFIMDNISNIKKIHYYYLLEDKERYIRNNKYLPAIYPEHRHLVV